MIKHLPAKHIVLDEMTLQQVCSLIFFCTATAVLYFTAN